MYQLDDNEHLKKYITYYQKNNLKDFALRINSNYLDTFPDYMPSTTEYHLLREDFIGIYCNENYFNISDLELYIRNNSTIKALFTYINEFISNNYDQFYYKKNNIIIEDYHLKIFNLKRLKIINGYIDDKTIKLINKYFKSLEIITFSNCHINKSTNLSILNTKIELNNCQIDTLSSLNNIKNNLKIKLPIINNYKQITISSPNVELNLKEEELKKLLLFITFPNTITLSLHGTKYSNSLYFLGTSMPNLNTLWLDATLYDLDFLYNLKNINKIHLVGLNENYLYDKTKIYHYLKNIKYDKNNQVEIECLIENEVLKIINSLKSINYTNFEKELFLKTNNNILLELMSNNTTYNYHYIYDSSNYNLYLESKINDNIKTNYIFNNYTYEDYKSYKISNYVSLVKHVIKLNPIIYNQNNIPIIFKKEENINLVHKDKIDNYKYLSSCYENRTINKAIARHEKKLQKVKK
jgi:hypothetical protein